MSIVYQVAAFGSAGPFGPHSARQLKEANELGVLLAKNNMQIVQGGGPGTMLEMRNGHREAGGSPVSIHLNQYPTEQVEGELVQGYDILSDRQYELIRRRHAYVAVAGGVGTAYEILQVVACKTVGEVDMATPVVCVGSCWHPLESMLYSMHGKVGTLKYIPEHLVTFVESVQDAVDIFVQHRNILVTT